MQPLLCSSKLSWASSAVSFTQNLTPSAQKALVKLKTFTKMCKNADIKVKAGKTKMYKTIWYIWERDVCAQPFFRSDEGMLNKYPMSSDGKQNIKKNPNKQKNPFWWQPEWPTLPSITGPTLSACNSIWQGQELIFCALLSCRASKKPLVLLSTIPFDAFQDSVQKLLSEHETRTKKYQWLHKKKKNLNLFLPHRHEEVS